MKKCKWCEMYYRYDRATNSYSRGCREWCPRLRARVNNHLRNCRFCGKYKGEYYSNSDYCSLSCREPNLLRCEGVYCPSTPIHICAVCGEVGPGVESLLMQDKKYWAVYSRAGKLEGVKLCANGACEMEWRLRHAYNNEKPFKIVAGWEAEQHRAESSVEQLQAEFDAVLEVTR